MSKDQRSETVEQRIAAMEGGKLDLSDLGLTELPVRALTGIRLSELRLNSNPISDLPDALANFGLTSLNLDNLPLERLPTVLRRMTSLRRLDLDWQLLKELPEWIGDLHGLRRLSLTGNKVIRLPESLGKLSQLEYLWVQACGLSEFPSIVKSLPNLDTLVVSTNPIGTIPLSFAGMPKLDTFFASNCQLTALPDTFDTFPELEFVNLENNNISALPPSMQRSRLGKLGLMGNPLPIPPEIMKAPANEIIAYYFTQRRQSTGVPLKETKMILVGQGEVGKTSLVKHLRGERVDTHESATQGIRVEPWQPGAVADDVKVRIWDFGGQEIMHATHQFFLTERTLYLVVLNSREDEHRGRLEYWLKLIQNFAAGAPTLIVCNKADQHRLDLDERGLRQKYPFILGVHRVSAVTGLGMDELTSAIGAAIRDLQHLQERFLPAEIAVKEKLEAPGGDYISYERYQQVCDEAGMPKDIRRKTLLRFLNDLGVVLSFVDDPQMMMTSVLRPDWVTDGVYAVLHAHMDGGVLHHAQLSEILKPSERYPEDKHGFIIEMMKKFELCFQYDTADRKTRYLIPDLLPKNEPDTGDWEGALRFEYQYEVLPSSIISRFIVRMQAMISKRTYWRTGVVLERNRNRALVKADLEEKRIRIAVDGNVMGRRELLDIIRAEFEQLHSTISQIAVKEKVPLPDAPGVLADYQHLRTLRDMFTLNFVPEGATRTYNVRHLLEGVDTEERMMASNRDKLAPLEREDPPPQRVAPPVSVAQVWGMGGFVLLAFAVVAVILIAGMQFAGALGFGLLALGILLSVALVLVIVLRMTGAINEARLERMTGGLLERLPLLRGGRDQTGSAPAPQQKPKRPRRTTPPA